LKARDNAIASLQTELGGVISELKARDNAIANLKPTPTPEPEQTTGTLSRGELLKYILEKFPDSGMEDHNIGDAVAGKTKRLSEFEVAYGFKYLGKIKGKNRFQLNSNL
jgi:hypothetical protein